MGKFLVVGDPHLGDVQIKSRVDNLSETSLKKVEWLLDTFKDVPLHIWTGDTFSSPIRSKAYLIQLKNILSLARGKIYTLIGNHSGDINYTQTETYKMKDVGDLTLDNYLTKLNYKEYGGLGFYGHSAYEELNEEVNNGVNVLICHHFIGEAFGDSLVIKPHEVKKIFPNLKLIVAGHDHAEYPVMEREGIKILRTGSLIRTDSGKSSQRIPRVALVDTETLDIEFIPVEVAKDFTQVFRLSQKDIKKDSIKEVEKFASNLKQGQSIQVDASMAIKELLGKLKEDMYKEILKKDLRNNGFING